MRLKNNRGKPELSVNPRGDGRDGLVIRQREKFIIMSGDEWQELRHYADAIIAEQRPKKRYRML